MTTIRQTTTTTTTTVTNDQPSAAAQANQVAQLTQALKDLSTVLNGAAAQQPAAPAQPQDGMMQAQNQTVNLSGQTGAKPMDVYSAAATLDKHFALAEGVGMDGKGKGAGDGNIGFSELKRLADPKSGAPPELQQAAKFMLEHKDMAFATDGAKGGGKDVHISRDDLKKMAANAPASSTPAANPNLAPTMSSSMMSQLGSMGNTASAAPTAQSAGGQQAAPMDAYGAAKTLADNFRFAEGMGVNGKGKGSGDGLIGPAELKQIVRPDSGATPAMKQAAQFLLDNPPAMASIGKMTQDNLKSFAAAAPPGAGSTGAPTAPAQSPSTGPASTTPGTQAGGQAGATKPMDIYGAAQALKNHFALAEGVGMDGKGKGAGDGNIGFSELKRLADPKSGAPAELQQAAKFLLENKMMTASLDRNNGANGDAHINMDDLNTLLANAPKDSGAAGATAAQGTSSKDVIMEQMKASMFKVNIS